MENNSLKIEKRKEIGGGRSRRLREHGLVPAIVYGRDMVPVAAHVKASELKGFIKHSGRNAVFNTEFAEEHDLSVLIKDIQYDPVNKEIIHLDFQKINQDKRVMVEVPVRITGSSSVQRAGNVVMHQMDTIKVECLPRDIPRYIEADVTGLQPGHSLTAGDMKFDDKISLITRPGDIIVTVNGHEREPDSVDNPVTEA